jgi:hypothetical protein
MTSLPAAAISPDKLISDSAIPTFSIPASFIPENNEDLGNEITRLAGHINAAQYRFLKLLAVLIERDAWGGGSGIKSPAHWLNYYCCINIGAAAETRRALHIVFSDANGQKIERALYPQFKPEQLRPGQFIPSRSEIPETGPDQPLALELDNQELGLNIDCETAHRVAG